MELKMYPSILIQSGNYFDLLDPENCAWMVEDIAHALANTCRFGGHTSDFYSVAQHSVLASQIVPHEYAHDALFHDAAEAFVGDVPSPLKQLLPDYKMIERNIERLLFKRLGVTDPLPYAVKHADLVMLATERRDLLPKDNEVWSLIEGIAPMREIISPWSPQVAKVKFLQRAAEIRRGLGTPAAPPSVDPNQPLYVYAVRHSQAEDFARLCGVPRMNLRYVDGPSYLHGPLDRIWVTGSALLRHDYREFVHCATSRGFTIEYFDCH